MVGSAEHWCLWRASVCPRAVLAHWGHSPWAQEQLLPALQRLTCPQAQSGDKHEVQPKPSRVMSTPELWVMLVQTNTRHLSSSGCSWWNWFWVQKMNCKCFHHILSISSAIKNSFAKLLLSTYVWACKTPARKLLINYWTCLKCQFCNKSFGSEKKNSYFATSFTQRPPRKLVSN